MGGKTPTAWGVRQCARGVCGIRNGHIHVHGDSLRAVAAIGIGCYYVYRVRRVHQPVCNWQSSRVIEQVQCVYCRRYATGQSKSHLAGTGIDGEKAGICITVLTGERITFNTIPCVNITGWHSGQARSHRTLVEVFCRCITGGHDRRVICSYYCNFDILLSAVNRW